MRGVVVRSDGGVASARAGRPHACGPVSPPAGAAASSSSARKQRAVASNAAPAIAASAASRHRSAAGAPVARAGAGLPGAAAASTAAASAIRCGSRRHISLGTSGQSGRPGERAVTVASAGYDASAVDEGVLTLPPARELRPDQITNVFGYPRDLETKYVLGRTLGAGSFGVVREATEVSSGRRYAVKTVGKVPKNKMATPYYLRKLRAEVEIMTQLGASLNAVNLKEVFEDRTSLHLVMQLCEGGQLLERVDSGRYTEAFVQHIVRSILRFLSQCHAKGFIYRDVKPDNFLFHTMDPDSPLKATDFGLSIRHTRGSAKLTSRSGTPAYMAPELIMQCYDEKSDVWSTGILTYQLLTGRFPFWTDVRRASLAEVWKAILAKKINWEAEELQAVNPLALDFLKKTMCRNPDERLSAEAALQHEWMLDTAGNEGPLMGSVVQRLQRFSTYGSLTQLVLKLIADEAMSGDNKLPTFETLSPELMEGIQELFDDLDKDKSGSVSLQELTQGLRCQGYSLSDNEIEQLMLRVDADHSGTVSAAEFMTTLVDWNKIKETDAWQAYVDFAFRKLDSDNSGTIDVNELLAQLPEGNSDAKRMAAAKSLLREADANGDGKITPAEFQTLLEHHRLVDSLAFYDARLSSTSMKSVLDGAADS